MRSDFYQVAECKVLKVFRDARQMGNCDLKLDWRLRQGTQWIGVLGKREHGLRPL